MPTEETSTRAPRGTKVVSRAFFAALEGVPEEQRNAVAKAAHAVIRDELKLRRAKTKAGAAKSKGRTPAAKSANGGSKTRRRTA